MEKVDFNFIDISFKFPGALVIWQTAPLHQIMACCITSLGIRTFDNIKNTINNNEIGIEEIFVIRILKTTILLVIASSLLIKTWIKNFVSEKPDTMNIRISLPFYEEFVFFNLFFFGFFFGFFALFFGFLAFSLLFGIFTVFTFFRGTVRRFDRFIISLAFGCSMT